MKIETFVNQLRKQNPAGNAYVAEKLGKRKVAVAVNFTANGKVYTYKGTIVGIAEKLGLIPEIDVIKESNRVISLLKNNEPAISYAHCSDTIRHFSGLRIDSKPAGTDEFDRPMVEFFIDTTPNLWMREIKQCTL